MSPLTSFLPRASFQVVTQGEVTQVDTRGLLELRGWSCEFGEAKAARICRGQYWGGKSWPERLSRSAEGSLQVFS